MDCVICIDAILVIVNYIFVIITACNDPCIYIYICYICIKKQRKQEQKNVTLPSAKAKALGKVTINDLQETLFAKC